MHLVNPAFNIDNSFARSLPSAEQRNLFDCQKVSSHRCLFNAKRNAMKVGICDFSG